MPSPTRPTRSSRSLRIDHARIDGRSVRYAVRPGDPDRTPLLFLNGLGANIELALPFIDALATPTVVIFDVPGVGGELYGGAFRSDPELVASTFRHIRFSSRGGYYLQLAAAFGWSSLPWLFTLRQPTLIMAGTDDPIVPMINARIMQWLIPDARL